MSQEFQKAVSDFGWVAQPTTWFSKTLSMLCLKNQTMKDSQVWHPETESSHKTLVTFETLCLDSSPCSIKAPSVFSVSSMSFHRC